MLQEAEFTVRTTVTANKATVQVVGEVDVATAPQLDQALSLLVAQGVTRFVLDMTGVTFMDSTGMRAVVRLVTPESRVTVAHASETIRKLFELTGVDRHIIVT